MPQHVVIEAARRVALIEKPSEPLGKGEVRIATARSVISSGTELRCFTGEFAPGTHWAEWVRYPMASGYSLVGRVVESSDDSRAVGARVFCRRPHASEVVLPARATVPVPEGISDDDAAWAALAMVGAMGFRAGDVRLTDDVAIVGLGPIGQIVLRWCVAAGARVHGFDPARERLAHALAGGATHADAVGAAEAGTLLRSRLGDGPRVAIDTTGVEAVFAQALTLPRDHGTLVLLGDAGDPGGQRLTPDVIRRGVRVVGAHMNHEDPTADWTEATIVGKFFALVASGRFSLAGLTTHRFSPAQAPEAFDLLARRVPGAMGMVFEWGSSSPIQ